MSNLTVPLLLALTGCLALLAGLFGGIKLKDLEIPTIGQVPRIFSGLLGLLLVGAAIWLYLNPSASASPQPTEAVKPVAPSTSEPSAAPTLAPPTLSPTATETPLPSASHTVPSTSTSAPSGSPTPIVADPTTPIGFLRYYFTMVAERKDYGDAWELLTRKYQQKYYPNGSFQYGTYWNTIKLVDLDAVQCPPVSGSNGSAVDCHVDMTLHATSGLASQETADYRLTFSTKLRTWMFDLP